MDETKTLNKDEVVTVAPAEEVVPPKRRRRPRPVVTPATPDQIAKAFKDFEGEGKKWSLPDEVWYILEEKYPFPIRKNMTLKQALTKAFPTWWLLEKVEDCAFPAIPSLYEFKAYLAPGMVIRLECKLIPPFDQLTDEEWEIWSNKGVGRVADVLFVEYSRNAPEPNLKKVAELKAPIQ